MGILNATRNDSKRKEVIVQWKQVNILPTNSPKESIHNGMKMIKTSEFITYKFTKRSYNMMKTSESITFKFTLLINLQLNKDDEGK